MKSISYQNKNITHTHTHTTSHDLILGKLSAYGFTNAATSNSKLSKQQKTECGTGKCL